MRTKEGQELHDKYVGIAAGLLAKAGYTNILVDLPGKVKPPKINGYIPDIYAQKTEMFRGILPINRIYIVEVETEDTHGTTKTLLQILSFRTWAMQNKAIFEEVVAK